MASKARTLVPRSPHLRGEDIGIVQHDPNCRSGAWRIKCQNPELPGELRHEPAPAPSVLRPAVQQHSLGHVQAHAADVDVVV